MSIFPNKDACLFFLDPFKGKGSEIWVVASFENGNLLVEGYDIGITVEQFCSGFDVEYSATVSKENLQAYSKFF